MAMKLFTSVENTKREHKNMHHILKKQVSTTPLTFILHHSSYGLINVLKIGLPFCMKNTTSTFSVCQWHTVIQHS